MTLIEACKIAMEEIGRPATAKEIHDYIVEKNYFIFETKTPQASVSSALSTLTNPEMRVYDESIDCIKIGKSNCYSFKSQKVEKEIEFLENYESDNVGNVFLNPKDVRIDVKPMVISNIISRIKSKLIDLNPPYQRKAHLWNFSQKSQLIESILLSFPLPAFYFVEIENGVYQVVDGLQRISAISHFILGKGDGKNKDFLKLQGLEYLNAQGLKNKTFKELSPSLRARIEEFSITAYIVSASSPDVVKFNLFKRINTSGLLLTDQEIRHALNSREASTFINKLASSAHFLDITNNAIASERMEDCDFITRFLAFYLLPHSEYQADMDGFLNKVMKKITNTDKNTLLEIEKKFEETINTLSKIFGDYAFRKRFDISEKKRNPINKALFEVLTVSFARLSKEEQQKIVQYKQDFNLLFVKLFNDNQGSKNFTYSITTGTGHKQNVLIRYEKIKEIIDKTLAL